MIIVDKVGKPITNYIRDINWEQLGNKAILLALLLVIAYLGSKVIARLSRWYSYRLEQKNQVGVSDTGVIRLRARDTKHRVVAAISRVILYTVLAILSFHMLFPQEGSALLGATLTLALIGFALQPFVRDVVAGASMLAEEWFQVGDTIYVEPSKVRGVVEHVNLRSTQLRTLAGEKVIIHNASITSVSVSPKGMKEMKLEIFVRDLEKGIDLVKRVSLMLPNGPAQLIRPLKYESSQELGSGEHRMWRIVCSAAVAPDRDWLLDDFALKLFREQDSLAHQILSHGPVVYNADPIGARRVEQSIIMNKR